MLTLEELLAKVYEQQLLLAEAERIYNLFEYPSYGTRTAWVIEEIERLQKRDSKTNVKRVKAWEQRA